MKGTGQIEDHRMHSYAHQEKLRMEEDIYCKQLATKLMSKLEMRGKLGDRGFSEQCKKDALELCEAPGGTELVGMVGYVYAQEGKQYAGRFLGLEGFWSQIQEKAHFASTGAAVIVDAVKTANMAQEIGDGQQRGVVIYICVCVFVLTIYVSVCTYASI